MTLLTVSEVAESVRLTESTIRNLILRGEIPACKIGKAYRIDAEAFDAYLTRSASRLAQPQTGDRTDNVTL